ncbi:hypothetical protein AJ88_18745 [Mesorhizobium amorphae CCBAU 01583]|nr:hypothetical protein AJ88_18745 [Mesorhizobium amorphae CCBAU 01583]
MLASTYVMLRKPRPEPEAAGIGIPAFRQLGAMAGELAYQSDHPVTYFGPGAYGWMWAPTSSMVFRRGALEPVLAFPFRVRTGTDYFAATCAHLAAGSLILSESLAFIVCMAPTYRPALPMPAAMCSNRRPILPTKRPWARMSSIMC